MINIIIIIISTMTISIMIIARRLGHCAPRPPPQVRAMQWYGFTSQSQNKCNN